MRGCVNVRAHGGMRGCMSVCVRGDMYVRGDGCMWESMDLRVYELGVFA